MHWFRNLRMTRRLVGSFVLVAILAAVVGGAGLLGLHEENDQFHHVENVSVPSLSHIQDVQTDAVSVAAYGEAALVSTSQSDVNAMLDHATAALNSTLQDWQAVLALPFDSTAEAALARQTIPLLHAGDRIQATVVVNGDQYYVTEIKILPAPPSPK